MARRPGGAGSAIAPVPATRCSKKLKAKRAKRHLKKHPSTPRAGARLRRRRRRRAPRVQAVHRRCVGANAGLVCDTTTGQCVNRQTFADCSSLQACFGGRCQGFVGCSDDGDCEGIAPSGLLPGLICNDNNQSPEIEDNVCIFNPLRARNNTNDCVPFMGLPWPVSSGRVLPIAAKPEMTIARFSHPGHHALRGRHLLRVRLGPWTWGRGRLRLETAGTDEASARSVGLVATRLACRCPGAHTRYGPRRPPQPDQHDDLHSASSADTAPPARQSHGDPCCRTVETSRPQPETPAMTTRPRPGTSGSICTPVRAGGGARSGEIAGLSICRTVSADESRPAHWYENCIKL